MPEQSSDHSAVRQSNQPLTAEDLPQMDADGMHGDLIRGAFCPLELAGQIHGVIAARLGASVFDHVERSRSGTVVGGKTGVWLERDPDTVRAPDAAYFSAERMPIGQDVPGYAEVVPDLVVEVVSSSHETHREVYDKARMWLSHGVRLAWVVHPDTRTVDVHRGGHPVETLAEDSDLDGLDVLAGFKYPLSRLFAA